MPTYIATFYSEQSTETDRMHVQRAVRRFKAPDVPTFTHETMIGLRAYPTEWRGTLSYGPVSLSKRQD